jgi:hypothetical protein
MRTALFWILILFNANCFGQFTIRHVQNIDLYKPYTEFAQIYIEKYPDKVSSHTHSSAFTYEFRKEKILSPLLGISYQYTNLTVKDRATFKNKLIYNDQIMQVVDTVLYQFNSDYINRSRSVGLNLGLQVMVSKSLRSRSYLGMNSTVYLWERCGASVTDVSIDLLMFPQIGYRQAFFLSSVNIETFYKYRFYFHERFSLAARVSIGTNLYSEWDQFRKYVWMGVGLELGFGPSTRSGTSK